MSSSTWPRRASGWVALAVGLLCSGCIEPLAPGDFGTFRYFGQVRGATPLPMLPPTTDRIGNVYVLYGNPAIPEAQAFVGKAGGGWLSKCTLTRGDGYGVHGWVGHTADKAWYWSGDAMVQVSGANGDCKEILPADPRTNSVLNFAAVVPFIRDTPSRVSAVALVQSNADALPYFMLIDLVNNFYLSSYRFTPDDASEVRVLGVGADKDSGRGYLLVAYQRGGGLHVEGRVIDDDAKILSTAPIDGADNVPAYGIAGYLQVSSDGLAVGLDNAGNLISFKGTTGHVSAVTGMLPVGVHVWDGKLWVVGTNAGEPVIARIDSSGNAGTPVVWGASKAAMASLEGSIEVEDERVTPRRKVRWDDPTSAMGPFPFVHAHTMERYADDMTGWLVAGPSFNFGGDRMTAVAFAPVGISYP